VQPLLTVSVPWPSRRNSRSAESSARTPPFSAQAQAIASALAEPPAETTPSGRSGDVYSPDRLHEKVADRTLAMPAEDDPLLSRSSTFDPSQAAASLARHWISLPSGQRS